jgi:beta-fructofuranosidase
MYDALTDTYHLFYQTFPNHVQGGNGSWGHATSGDLVTWEDVGGWQNDEYLALKPGPYPQYDWIGDWTGNAQPVNLKGEADGNLTAIFTCVHKFPVGWTLPEEPGSEQQCIATSSDGGVTWQKYEHNPIMSLPPSDWNFTGWRDPHFQAMPEIDELLGYDEPHYYMTLGSGIKGAGPRMPLYKAKASDLTDWSFMGALFEIPANYSWGGDPFRTGSVGFNIELPGFFSLVEQEEFGGDGETLHYAVNMGTEGGNNTYHPSPRWTMFGLGSVSHRENGSVSLDLDVTAPIDWGVFYAATTFNDTKHNRRVIWGWSDEDMNDYGITAQGFQGALGLPRELFIHKTHNVTAPSDGRLTAQTGNWTETSAGLYTVKTLGSRPLPDVVEALHSSKPVELTGFRVGANQTVALKGLRSQHFHLQASVKVDSSFSSVGFITHATPNMEE